MTPLRDAAENATAGVPVVRGLDWLRQTDGILSRAETELGTYRVWTFAGARRWHWELSRGYQRFSGSAADEDLALAAAQADYEQRILSALNPDYVSELDTARAEIERLREALTPSGDTKAAYMGEFYMDIARMDEAGDGYTESIAVSWTTIKEIMAAIKARATLSPAVKEPK